MSIKFVFKNVCLYAISNHFSLKYINMQNKKICQKVRVKKQTLADRLTDTGTYRKFNIIPHHLNFVTKISGLDNIPWIWPGNVSHPQASQTLHNMYKTSEYDQRKFHITFLIQTYAISKRYSVHTL